MDSMDTTELIVHLKTLADVVEDSHPDASTCLTTIIGALTHDKMDELSDVMVQFTVETVGELIKDNPRRLEIFQEILQENMDIIGDYYNEGRS